MTTEVEPIDWEIFEAAVYDWLVDVSKIVPRAEWEKQDAVQSAYPYASMLVTSIVKEGGQDEIRTDTDDSRDDGQEIRFVNTGPLRVVVSVSFHVDAAHLANTGPNGSAQAKATQARASLGQLSVIEHFRKANIAIVRELAVTDTSLVINGEWLSRATLDVLLRTTASMTEYAGYIDKVQLKEDDFGIDVTVDTSG